MSGQITRRPFTDCPYTWTTTISGISSGSGTVGNRQCQGMNVADYAMKFRACDSTGDKLIWVGKCFVPPPPTCFFSVEGRNMCDVSTVIDVPAFGASLGDMDINFRSENFELPNENFDSLWFFTPRGAGAPNIVFRDDSCNSLPVDDSVYGDIRTVKIGNCPSRLGGSEKPTVQSFTSEGAIYLDTSDQQRVMDGIWGRYDLVMMESIDLLRTRIVMTVNVINLRADDPSTEGGGAGFLGLGKSIRQIYVYETADNVFDFDDDIAECERTLSATLIGDGQVCAIIRGDDGAISLGVVAGFAPPSIQITTKFSDDRNGLEGVVGADAGDRGNATWRLEYDIEQTLWTLHSFERIEYPIYTLVDADPCVGLTKILTRVQASSGNGCEVSPDTVTITRGCPDNLSYRSRDARTRTQCARTRQRKGCDCQNMPIDERWRSVTKCFDITTLGCEDYGDDVKCRYPKNQLTCSFCGDKDIPCTYEALFGGGIVGQTGLCDIIYDDTDIAASTVTLRQRCRFEGPCNWVAVGPTDDKRDGVVGHEPYCMLCAGFAVGSCASNCTWEAVQAASCPASGSTAALVPPKNILDKWGISWSLNVAEPATLTYDHPSFGVLIYATSEDEPFLCDNVNTMYLTAQGNLPDGVMPESICVRPRYSGCGGAKNYDIKSDAYEEVEDQIACCDPACGSLDGSMTIVCCTQPESCESVATAQTVLLGLENPAGPSYLTSCTLHGVQWTAVLYCDGTQWLSDWYCGNPRQFITTNKHTHTCCPLVLSYEPLPENFNGVTCCPQADCTCNFRDEVTLTFTIVEPGATTASNCGPNPADCSDGFFDAPISITLTRDLVTAHAKYVGEACFLGGLPFEFQLTCGYDGINDVLGVVGDYQLLIFPPPAFSTCLDTDALRFSEMRQNLISAPALLIEFDDYFCGEDHADVDCRVFSNITITG